MRIVIILLLLAVHGWTYAQVKDSILTQHDSIQSKELSGVILRTKQAGVRQNASGLVVSPDASLLTKGSSILQVLEKSPGVVVNHRDNSIELNGKNGVLIMINGKALQLPVEQVVNLLSGMSGEDVESIELMTTPPAGYDAQGSAGVVNIVLRNSKQLGTFGTVSLGVGMGKRGKGTVNLQLFHNLKKFRLHGSYASSLNQTFTHMDVISNQKMAFLGGDIKADGKFETRATRKSYDVSIGFDADILRSLIIGTNLNFNNTYNRSRDNNQLTFTVLPDSILQFDGINRVINQWKNLASNFYIEQKMKKAGKLNLDFSYLFFNNDADGEGQNQFVNANGAPAGTGQILFSPRQRTSALTSIYVSTLKLDHQISLRKNIKLESGVKIAHTRSESQSGIEALIDNVWQSDNQTSSDNRMTENISALYSSAVIDLKPGLIITAGIRYENSNTKMHNNLTGKEVTSRRLSAFFPNVQVSYKMKDLSSIRMVYTKRISRPSFNDLASYVGYSDPTAIYTGNPFLKPTITKIIMFGYSYKRNQFSVLISRDENPIARYQLTESPSMDMLIVSPQNLRKHNQITLQMNLPFRLENWWNGNFNWVGGYRHYELDFTHTPLSKSYFGTSTNLTQDFQLNKGISLELTAVHYGVSFDGTKRVNGFGTISMGIKKELRNDKGSFSLSVTDLLSSEKYIIRFGTLTREAFAIRNKVSFFPESASFPLIRLNYSRSFGKKGMKQSAKIPSSSAEEFERVRKE